MNNDWHGGDILTCMYNDRDSAQRAYESARARGYRDDEIHMLMSDETRKRHFGELKTGNKSLEGTGVGAMTGGAIGAAVMGFLAAGTTLAIPGIGLLIAGPLAGALAGGAAGGVAGTLVGALVGAGIPETRARQYEKDIRNGGILIGVTPRSEEDARFFENEWGCRRAA